MTANAVPANAQYTRCSPPEPTGEQTADTVAHIVSLLSLHSLDRHLHVVKRLPLLLASAAHISAGGIGMPLSLPP